LLFCAAYVTLTTVCVPFLFFIDSTAGPQTIPQSLPLCELMNGRSVLVRLANSVVASAHESVVGVVMPVSAERARSSISCIADSVIRTIRRRDICVCEKPIA